MKKIRYTVDIRSTTACIYLARDLLIGVVRVMGLAGGRHVLSVDGRVTWRLVPKKQGRKD